MTETNSIPTQEVLRAFHVSGKSVKLEGGEGTCYRVGDVVFKPTKDPVEAAWIAEINVTVRFWVAKYQEYQASEPDLLIRMRGYKYRLDV